MSRPGLARHDRALTVPGHVTRTTRGPWVAAPSPVPPRADGFSPWGFHLAGGVASERGSRGRTKAGRAAAHRDCRAGATSAG